MRSLPSALLASTIAAAVGLALATLPATPASAAAAFDQPSSDFVSASSVTLTGTKDAGSTLVIRRDGQVACTVSDPDALTWVCAGVSVPNGVVQFTGDETLADESVEPLAPLTLRVLAPPSIDGGGSTVVTTGLFSGSARPGASIQLSATGSSGTTTHSCPAALGSGFWSCAIDLPSGQYQVRARQQHSSIGPEQSGFSSSVNAAVDRDAPAAPVITSPGSGSTDRATTTVRGTGEPSALLQVFVDGVIECETTVRASGAWACPLRWPREGTLRLQALQRDAAGNFSAASERVTIRFTLPDGDDGEAPPPATPDNESQTETDDGSGTGGTGTTPSPEPTQPGTTPSPDPSDPTDDGGTAITSNWGTATAFGASLPTASEVVQRGGWLLAPLLGLAYLLLVALPVRWFTVYVRPRMALPRLRLTGRNRALLGDDDAPILPPMLVAAATLGGAAVIAALAGGIGGDVRYLRLMAAIGLGMLVLNIVGVLLPARLAGRVARQRVGMRLLPGILLVALATALLSRFVGLQPPVLVGVLIAGAIAVSASRRARAGVAVAQSSAVAALALLGWFAHDLLTPSTGFWMSLWAETAAAVALAGLGSLLVLLLPVGPLPGRTLYASSPPAWAIVSLASAGLAGAILSSGPAFPVLSLVLVALALAATLCAAVVWVRWIAPALR